MLKNKKKLIGILLSSFLLITFYGSVSHNVYAKENIGKISPEYNFKSNPNIKVQRLGGKDRFETSQKICEQFAKEHISNVIIANGNNFPDALTGSVLSKKLNAPILLVDKTLNGSKNSIKYIESNLSKDGTIFILGSKDVVEDEFISYFNKKGYKNIKRLGGNDRFDTNKIIVDNMKVEKGTPVVIVTGENFPDALSVSSVAAIKGYPILMSKKNSLPEIMKDTIKDIQPSKVFLIGSEGVLGDNIVNEVNNLVPEIQSKNILRLYGEDRYETSLNIFKYFKNELDNKYAVIAIGSNFPDALSGGALASKLKAPILLTDGSNILTQKKYIDENKISNMILLGSKFCIGEGVENILRGKEEHLFYIEGTYEKDRMKYIEGRMDKFITNVDEALEYQNILGSISVPNYNGEYFLEDGGVDTPISDKIKLTVSDSAIIKTLAFDNDGNKIITKVDFGKFTNNYKNKRPIYRIKIKNGLVTEIEQQYRP
ncbi:cell wall-binding repeat-containing protein [Clostridium niameyense]|nr:cell wall-binding repeat-containing protein [Clostridium niameyense]